MLKTTRRDFLALSVAAAAGLAAPGAMARNKVANASRPNVVIIVTDDQGYGDFHCFGNPAIETPSLDRLHDESARLGRFYVCPVCAPTRACLFTGRYNYRSGVVDTYVGRALMDAGEVTLADVMQRGGYATGLFGKWHLGDSYPLRPMDRGFQETLTLRGGGLCQPGDPRVTSYFDPILWRNGEEVRTKGYCTDVITNAAIDFVRAHRHEPFLTVITTNAPHNPLDVDDKYVAPYRAKGVPAEDAKVYGMISNLDENVGRFLGELDTLGLRENTIVVFFTDNGAQFTKDGPRFSAGQRAQKGTVYEGGIRVPCFVRWPGVLSPTDHDGLAAAIDVMPTVLAACGVRPPQGVALDGNNLLPALRDGAAWPDRTYFTQWHRGDAPEANKNACAVTQRYKLIDGRELYDLEKDPGEAHDIAAEQPDVVRDLRAQYDAWFADVCGTRGFAPVPITVGTKHESPTWLTAQDMREVNNWGAGDVGSWELDVARAGEYTFEVNWVAGSPPGAGTIALELGDHASTISLDAGETVKLIGPLKLNPGRARLGVTLTTPQGKRRPDWILVRRA